MVKILHFFLLLQLFSVVHAKNDAGKIISPDSKSDSIIRKIFSDYQKVFTTTKNEKDLINLFICEKEWKELLEDTKLKQPNCISLDESEFNAELNFKTYEELISSNIIIKQLFVSKIEYVSSCGNLFTMPRVTCAVQYNNNEVVNVPFLLIKTLNNEYKIIRNFLSYKIFPNE